MSALANDHAPSSAAFSPLPQSSNPADEQDLHKISDSDLAPVESVREVTIMNR